MHILEKEYNNLDLWYFVSFIFGIVFFFESKIEISSYILTIIIIICGVLVRLFYQKNIFYFFLSCCLFAFLIGILVANFRVSNIDAKPIKKVIFTEISGIVDQIKPTTSGTQVTLKNIDAKNHNLKIARINISSKLMLDISHGDVIKFKAKLFPLQSSVLPGTFDFGFYMYLSGIEATGYALTNIEIIKANEGLLHTKIKKLRRKMYNRLISILGKDKGNFAAAILIGETKAIPRQISENMRNTGVAHILSVSGLHLSLVAMIFFVAVRIILNLSNFLAHTTNIKNISAIISIIGSFAYLQISGSNIAAMRAFIMTSIFIIAIILGRSTYPLRSVMIAAFLILAFLPEYVLHPSFQLSFSAVLCLISGYELYIKNKHFLGHNKGVISSIKFYIFANIYSSFLAGIVTTPFVIFHFYKFAVYSVLMNLIAVPIMSFFMMPLGLLSVILMSVELDKWILQLLGCFITITIDSAHYIVELPKSIWITGSISSLSLLIFTFGFFWICIWQSKWRFYGIIIMFISVIMMFFEKKPEFIYDHKLKAVGIVNHEQELEILSEKELPVFISNYWANWYGQESVNIKNTKISATNKLFKLQSGKTISLNYSKCYDADIQIITSKILKCHEYDNKKIIYNHILWKHKQILAYCAKSEKCHVEYAREHIWPE